METRALITGFQPFGGRPVNPSERLCQILAASCACADATPLVLPVAYRRASAPVIDALENGRCSAALMLGLGAGRATVDFERFAVNWRGGPQPDEDGVRIAGEPIDPGGPAAYFASAPVDALVAACKAAGTPSAPSSHAGTFLCNQVFFEALRHCDRADVPCRVAFAHLPLFPEMASAGEPAVSQGSLAAGLAAALTALVESATS